MGEDITSEFEISTEDPYKHVQLVGKIPDSGSLKVTVYLDYQIKHTQKNDSGS